MEHIDNLKGFIMEFTSDRNPTASAIYLVNRDKQGKYYRYFNAETGTWSMCGSTLQEATDYKDKPSPDAVGFFPWVGPLTGPNYVTESTKVRSGKKVVASKKVVAPVVVSTPVEKIKKPKAKLVVTKVGNTTVGSIVKGSKTVHPDGTVFFREDRQKWIAMMGGKQEAARPTPEACLAFLKKKYNVDGVVLK